MSSIAEIRAGRADAGRGRRPFTGLRNMMRGGSGNFSNKMMQLRVLLQALAIVRHRRRALSRAAWLKPADAGPRIDGKGVGPMVVLNKIYTRTGDDGTTALGTRRAPRRNMTCASRLTGPSTRPMPSSGSRVSTPPAPDRRSMRCSRRIQNDLFDVGADLAVAGRPDSTATPSASPSPLRR